MGSGSSRPRSRPSESRPSSPPVNRSPSRILSSIICGGSSSSSSRAAAEVEGRPYEMLKSSVENDDTGASKIQSPILGSAGIICSETVSANSGSGIGHSSTGSSITASKRITGEGGLRNSGTSNQERRFSETLELVSSQVCDEYSYDDSFRNRYSGHEASTSFREQQSSDPLSVNTLANKHAVNGIDNPENSRYMQAESSSQGLLHTSSFGRASVENHMDEMTTWPLHNSDSVSVQETNTEDLGLPIREQAQDDGDVLHVDVVSISSRIFSRGTADRTSYHETRRNSRRLFWDAFSRRSSWRPMDSPTIVLSTDDSPDDLQSQDRWLLNFSGNFLDDGVTSSDSEYLRSRIHSWTDRRRQSRSEIWERLVGSLDDDERRTTFCPSGLHPEGTCSCETLLSGRESSTRANISRIVMLAEALFEVLDEIHRQPSSLSMSMVSLPAPESVVDSFPLKNHKKEDKIDDGEEAEQCYICLSDYEEGDKIRVLPCHHEYHMSCVDKWLKEIHGVCPLCRGDVRQGENDSVSTSEIPSL
ncbi:unnamed protein product [Linum trigynum]|uniref:RING-type domain-containing protein n=1 Tax=Linum trigynum TaxID=586398 RepID=A0AAV2GVN9_9ROSI